MITMDPVGHIFSLLIIIDQGVSQLIKTQREVTSTIGENVVLKCHLTQSKDVRQVSWQKTGAGGVENVGSYSLRGGQWINPTFMGKVEFGNAELLNSSIVVRGVDKQDEGCYRCLFNAYPEGALTGVTCLKVHELHSPVLQITSNTTEDLTVSCSSTGQPAPTVVLNIPDPISGVSYSSTSVANANGTVTVTEVATFLALGYRGNGMRVRCVASLCPEVIREVLMTIPAVEQSFVPGVLQTLKDNGCDSSVVIVIVFCVTFAVCTFGGVTVALVMWKMRQTRPVNDQEKTKTPVSEKVISGVGQLFTSPARLRSSSKRKKVSPQSKRGSPGRQGEVMQPLCRELFP